MSVLPELRHGSKLRLPSGLVVTVLVDRSKATKRASEYMEQVYRLTYPARVENGVFLPGITGRMRLTLDDLCRLDAEEVEK